MSFREENVDIMAENFLKSVKIPSELKKPTTNLVKKMMSHDCYANPDYEWSLNDFELGRRLGRGKFGRVFIAREKKTGLIVALKTLLKKEIVEGGVEKQILREIEIQSHLKHPNILQLLCWFHDSHRIYLAVDYAGKGELYKHLQAGMGGHFTEKEAAKYTYQVADAVNYCHKKCVIHRDIKPENLLLTYEGNVKLADFGWSVHSPSLQRDTMCGTLDYLPPEMVEHRRYGKYVDHWCLGVLCYEFLVGHPPFESKTSEETYHKIRHVDLKFPEDVPSGARDLISKLLTRSSHKRMSLNDVMCHPWIFRNK
ncbi:aurora kinase C [Tribolium castaneum]|uniref:aurora kinase C n=1 Tax=Tribolium castaneum TaxID=7070 RepID=UPI0030FE107F